MSRQALLLGLLAAVLAGCGPRRPNVVLISIDTLRPDHLGCYGYPRNTSPAIDLLCADGVRFDQAIAHAPSTLPSHASMMSSMLPQHHGASYALRTPLPEDALTVAEVLRAAGYRTASFNGGGQIGPDFGIAQGFEIYDSRQLPLDQQVDQAITWIDGRGGAPFLLFLHTYDVHHPYTPEPATLALFDEGYDGPVGDAISIDFLRRVNAGKVELTGADLAHVVATYDAEIRAMDRSIGRLLEELEARRLYDDALVVFTSDHGEEFGEHGRVGWHSHSLYDELLRVPLIFKLPGAEHRGTAVSAQVRLIDLAPTILEEAGLPVPPQFAGLGLRQVVEGGLDRPLPAISLKDTERQNYHSLRYRGLKWVHGRLFNVVRDPGERQDLSATHAGTAAELGAELSRQLAGAEKPAAEPVELDDAARRQLEALGYIDADSN